MAVSCMRTPVFQCLADNLCFDLGPDVIQRRRVNRSEASGSSVTLTFARFMLQPRTIEQHRSS